MTGPHPDVAAARLAVRRSLADLAPHALVLVACSGGPDSVALAAATAFVAPRMGLRAGAVCIDHRLQPGSGPVAAAAVETCRSLGLEPAWSEAVEVTGPGGVEAAAREARYVAFAGAAARLGASAVLLGHTLDDQAETVLLGLARGSGARSLAGMARTRGMYRRPLLGLRRVQTESVCAALELGTWADPMNASLAHRRVAVRRGVIPALVEALGPGAVPALAKTAELLRADADLLDALAAELLAASTVEPTPTGEAPLTEGPESTADLEPTAADQAPPAVLELDIATLAAAAPALLGRALRAATTAVGSPPGDVGAVHVNALAALVTGWHGQGPLDLPGGVEATRRYGRLMLRATTPS